MAMLWEKVVVTAKEFLETKNINDSYLLNDPLFRAKLVNFEWDLSFSAASIVCELIWKKAIGSESLNDGHRLDRLFSPPDAGTTKYRSSGQISESELLHAISLKIWVCH